MTRKIIALSGPPGAGKSTLARGLVANLNAHFVQYDDFEVITSWPPERVISWLDADAPMTEVVAPGLWDALVSKEGLIVLETPFGRTCPATGHMIDVAIWLECPNDVALARKLSALARHQSGNAGFAGMISGWLDSYQRFTRRALAIQRSRVKPTANAVVSAETLPDTVLSSTLISLKTNFEF